MSHVRLLLLSSTVLFAIGARGQAHSITEPQITTCTGALLDSGGQGASGYSDNEDFTSTICSDQPGQAITLNWITFNLNTDGGDPIDQLTIYDGPDNTAPVIGTYTGTNSPGIVSASFANTSGCLTLHFTSNSTGTGIFAATILCYTPCEPPTAVVTMSEPAPALICQGEALQFNASGSYAAQGYNVVEYAWNFDDGSVVDSTTGPVVSHAFQEPGEYIVQIVLTDDNNCANTNTIDLAVQVSTTPVFNLSDTSVCLGNDVPLNGEAVPTTWTALPGDDLGGGVFLPDNVGETFITQLNYNNVFAPGATLQNIDQLLTFCINMEHSFMGDIVIQLVCPNGQSVVVHQQGGGGTFLGEPVDDDLQPDAQGVCYNYCWSPTATNGTWVDNSGGTLPPGTYESLNPMSALQGCPLNGTWTLNITDLWGSDNGFVCDWGLDFDPALYPDLTTYTPVLGLSTTDSTFWSGDGVVLDSNDPTTASVTPTSPGSNIYVFTVTDNFGCTYSDSITVTASGPLAQFDVQPVSPQPVGITAQFTDTSVPNNTTITGWNWDFGNGTSSTVQNPVTTFSEPGTYTVTLTITSSDGCTST
ncbi:MAG TPA: PKD domain-containing protein, partial [Flavobacteriales bacterium]|nr:PKD domain-containing protein [Flavobacteriales bacterium]